MMKEITENLLYASAIHDSAQENMALHLENLKSLKMCGLNSSRICETDFGFSVSEMAMNRVKKRRVRIWQMWNN